MLHVVLMPHKCYARATCILTYIKASNIDQKVAEFYPNSPVACFIRILLSRESLGHSCEDGQGSTSAFVKITSVRSLCGVIKSALLHVSNDIESPTCRKFSTTMPCACLWKRQQASSQATKLV